MQVRKKPQLKIELLYTFMKIARFVPGIVIRLLDANVDCES